MLTPNQLVNIPRIATLLQEQYSSEDAGLEFVPLGEDSWSYRCGQLWISIRRDCQGHVPAAYQLAHALRAAGWESVLAPLAGLDGKIVHEIDGFPILVFPYVAAEQIASSQVRDNAELLEVVDLLERLHRTRTPVKIPSEDFELPFADDLRRVIQIASAYDPKSGPYSQRLHALIRHHRTAIDVMLTDISRLGNKCRAAATPFVVTHGDPSGANILRHRGHLLLADWGAARLGPPERDWFHVLRTLGIHHQARSAFLQFYELRWHLSEIAEYTMRFTQSHIGDTDDDAMWGRLLHYLPQWLSDQSYVGVIQGLGEE